MGSAVSICQQALVLIGAQPIVTLEDTTTEGIACSTLYEPTVEDELSQYRWRFATKIELATASLTAPLTKWGSAYQIPSTCLVLSTVYINGQPIDFDRYEDEVWCNATAADEVYIEGIFRVSEATWPPFFERLIVYRMAAQLAHSIAAQVDTSDLLDRRAIRHAALARNRDAQGRTATKIDTSRFIRARSANNNRFVGGTISVPADGNPFDDLAPLP
jgi:hypothetical protein